MKLDLALALDVVRRACDAAARAALPFHARGVAVETKADHSPVTEADRASERAILGVIQSVFPTHSILAEESGAHAGDPRARWIVDPLDGTRGFTRGGSFWGPLVALEHEGEIVAGGLALPVLGDHYWAARGLGAWRNGSRLCVSSVATLTAATFSFGELGRILQRAEAAPVIGLIRDSASTRAFGDVAAIAMLLDGRADVWLESGVQPWDLAPVKVLVEEAGGRFTTFNGRASVHAGDAVATNGLLHETVLTALNARAAC